jgi:rfaE bifunctional protein nucleotidyltransferase chain/domain
LDTRRKIVSLGTLKRAIKRHKRLGQKIAFTNGCFDILHLGHVRYLEKAKQKGRILIVGLNSDRSVRKIKGSGRPVQNELARAGVLAALACVDYVTLFEEITPDKLVSEIKPDVLIKGADWKGKHIVGSETVLRNKGRVELIVFEPGFSTTQIITKIKKSA